MKQSSRQNIQILWLPYSCKLKSNLHWSKDLMLRILGILNFFAAQDFTKDPSSMANVTHIFPTLCLKISWKLGYFRSFFCCEPNFL